MTTKNKKHRKTDILEAAVKLFNTNGYLKTSIDDISQAVGLTKGGVYHHIDRKEDLLTEIHDHMANAYIDRLKKYVVPELDPHKKLVNYLQTHVEIMRDFQDYIKVFFTEAENLSKKSAQRIMEKRDIGKRILHDIIVSGVRARQFRDDLDPAILTFLILGMINWLYLWYRTDGPRSIEEITEIIRNFVFRGISKPY